MSKHYDFLVIGGGSGGYAAARTAHSHGKRVAIVDGSQKLGGLCILRGCMPSKTLIYSAEVLHLANHAELFGLDIPSAKVDMKALHKRKQAMVAEFADYRQEQLESERFDLYRSRARFTGKNSVLLEDGTALSADKIVIAVGSQVNTPSVEGLDDARTWTSDEVLDLDTLPQSVIVLGGGVIACELAQFLSRIGTQVTLIQRSAHVLKEHGDETGIVVEKVFREEGIEVITDTALERVQWDKEGVEVVFKQGGEVVSRRAKHLFNALGRKPATAFLDLEKAGVECLASGHIQTCEFSQSTNGDVYAVGDCAGPHEIVHVAILQGECAGNHACEKPATPVDYDVLTSVVFTDPQVAYVGLSEAQMSARGIDFLSADYPFDDHGKSIVMEAKHGFVKVWAERSTGRVLAAQCISKDASELIHALAVAVALKATVRDLLKVHWYHPTLAEIWSYPLEDIAEELSD